MKWEEKVRFVLGNLRGIGLFKLRNLSLEEKRRRIVASSWRRPVPGSTDTGKYSRLSSKPDPFPINRSDSSRGREPLNSSKIRKRGRVNLSSV